MADATVPVALVRALHLAASLSLLGAVGFIVWVLPRAGGAADTLRRKLIGLWWISGMAALVAGLVWFTLQAAAIADATSFADVLKALPLVALHTRFGNLLIMRSGLLVIASLLGLSSLRMNRRDPATRSACLALILTMVALGLQGFIGHAGAMFGGIGNSVVLFEAMHLLAAGVWLGGLLPLLLGLRTLSPPQAAGLCERFSPIGLTCVLVLAGTGLFQGLELIVDLFGTPYGQIALLKITLFLLALGLAAANRLWLTDRVASGAPASRWYLSVSIGLETALGLAIVTAAAFLASSTPGMHHAPTGPFSWWFGPPVASQDAGVGRQISISLIAVGTGLALLAGVSLVRRLDLPAITILAAAWRGRSRSRSAVEVDRTTFSASSTQCCASPVARAEASARNRSGRQGADQAPAASSLAVKPLDLESPPTRGPYR